MFDVRRVVKDHAASTLGRDGASNHDGPGLSVPGRNRLLGRQLARHEWRGDSLKGLVALPCLEFDYAPAPEPAIEVLVAHECTPPWLTRHNDRMTGIRLRSRSPSTSLRSWLPVCGICSCTSRFAMPHERPLERPGVNGHADVAASSAGRSAPIRYGNLRSRRAPG